MNSDEDLIFGAGRQIVCVLLDAVKKQRHIRIVPCDRLVQLHQQKLVVDAWVRSVNDANDGLRVESSFESVVRGG